MIKVKLIGFDSMGTRGMATVIDIDGYKIFIDPGVSIAPRRYGLPPHPLELEYLDKYLSNIYEEIYDSHIVVISHYHRDHYLYRDGEAEYYRDKILLIKDPIHNINYSQKIRAYRLLKKQGVENIANKIVIADNNIYETENIEIVFSEPVPHGPDNTRLGYVVMTLIKYNDYKILHASDVQGPISHKTLNIILEYRPDLLIISGPPTYFEGYRIEKEVIETGLKNLETIVDKSEENSIIIVDHHLLRDISYRERLSKIYMKSYKRKIKLLTAAEYMGMEIKQLEALRRELWKRNQ